MTCAAFEDVQAVVHLCRFAAYDLRSPKQCWLDNDRIPSFALRLRLDLPLASCHHARDAMARVNVDSLLTD